ncbi:hypothetical protein [Streptomyces sp. IBSBF 3136]|uniref:hypothetical protein n=1 Tax=Streptomyces sp. IBSBF 3136 TaxID=2903524 RepID=UPI002FDC548F
MTATVRRRIPQLLCASCLSAALLVSAGATTAIAASDSSTDTTQSSASADDDSNPPPSNDQSSGEATDAGTPATDTGAPTGETEAQHQPGTSEVQPLQPATNTGAPTGETEAQHQPGTSEVQPLQPATNTGTPATNTSTQSSQIPFFTLGGNQGQSNQPSAVQGHIPTSAELTEITKTIINTALAGNTACKFAQCPGWIGSRPSVALGWMGRIKSLTNIGAAVYWGDQAASATQQYGKDLASGKDKNSPEIQRDISKMRETYTNAREAIIVLFPPFASGLPPLK